MTLRTWAVWEKNKILTYFLFGFLFIIWSGGFVIAGIFNSTVRCEFSVLHFCEKCDGGLTPLQLNLIRVHHISDATLRIQVQLSSYPGYLSWPLTHVRYSVSELRIRATHHET